MERSCFELNILIILALPPELHYQQSEQVYEANGGEIRALFFLNGENVILVCTLVKPSASASSEMPVSSIQIVGGKIQIVFGVLEVRVGWQAPLERVVGSELTPSSVLHGLLIISLHPK